MICPVDSVIQPLNNRGLKNYLSREFSDPFRILLLMTFFCLFYKLKPRLENLMPFLLFRRDHLRSTSGIICGPIWGSSPPPPPPPLLSKNSMITQIFITEKMLRSTLKLDKTQLLKTVAIRASTDVIKCQKQKRLSDYYRLDAVFVKKKKKN